MIWPLSDDFLYQSKWILALLAVGVLTWDLFVRRNPQMACGVTLDRTRKLRMGILTVLALFAAGGYVNFGMFHYEGRPLLVHRWDMMHYYLGSKYFPENGYDRMYLACVAAEVENGTLHPADYDQRKIRRMDDYAIVPVRAVLDRLPEVKGHFSPARWQSFQRDLAYFRSVMPLPWYQSSLFDHGYNPSPIWNAVGTTLTNALPPADDAVINGLGLLDLLLLLVLFAGIAWAFGWQVMLVSLIVFSVGYPSRWMWTGGSLLRLDWLVMLGLGLSFLKKRWWVSAGACLAYSAGVRGFPVVVLFGPAVVVLDRLWRGWRGGRSWPEMGRATFRRIGGPAFLLGFTLSGALLAGYACLAVGSWQVWPNWFGKMKLHSQTALTNYMGLPFWMSYDHGQRAELTHNDKLLDPFLPWKEKQRETFRHIQPYYYAAAALALVLVALAVRGYPVHVAAGFSLVLIFVFFNLTCYYYSFLAFLPLVATKKRLEWVSIGLLALCAGQYLLVARMIKNGIGWYDQQFAAVSELTLVYLLIAAGIMIAGHGWVRKEWKRLFKRT